jgi:hypothetical protein
MPLRDRPDFKAWLENFETRHVALHGQRGRDVETCDGCGEPLGQPPSATDLCLVCLAESYGRERGQIAGRIAGILEAAIIRLAGPTVADIRSAVEDVLERYERESAQDVG